MVALHHLTLYKPRVANLIHKGQVHMRYFGITFRIAVQPQVCELISQISPLIDNLMRDFQQKPAYITALLKYDWLFLVYTINSRNIPEKL